jgi:hypothetical protein
LSVETGVTGEVRQVPGAATSDRDTYETAFDGDVSHADRDASDPHSLDRSPHDTRTVPEDGASVTTADPAVDRGFADPFASPPTPDTAAEVLLAAEFAPAEEIAVPRLPDARRPDESDTTDGGGDDARKGALRRLIGGLRRKD